ncbi:pyridoxamine 5'-phosphate oxidase family protein [Sphingobacterium suaedae]|uniref:Pyridoxamine 5'-phosphate oxidase family protein n=1 Tax=Sphingobacterium suaedae TaxID=1686402 RepID=A0ABW5KCC6_9SPHI
MEEINNQNLSGEEALAKIREITADAKTCFFCTDIRTGVPMSVRPMNILQVDDSGYFWFMTAEYTRKDDEVLENPFVHVLVQRESGHGFLNIYGIAEPQDNPEKAKELWRPELDVWFDGPEDPQIVLIRVEVLDGHYWDNKSSAPVAAFKSLKALITGKREDNGVQGDIEI